jgi:hypothetical protein
MAILMMPHAETIERVPGSRRLRVVSLTEELIKSRRDGLPLQEENYWLLQLLNIEKQD